MYLTAMHKVDPVHLAEVVAEMRQRGAPTVRAVDVGGRLLAIEGTHRLAAAAALGITPDVQVVDAVPEDSDVDDGAFRGRPLAELVEYLLSGDGPTGALYEVS